MTYKLTKYDFEVIQEAIKNYLEKKYISYNFNVTCRLHHLGSNYTLVIERLVGDGVVGHRVVNFDFDIVDEWCTNRVLFIKNLIELIERGLRPSIYTDESAEVKVKSKFESYFCRFLKVFHDFVSYFFSFKFAFVSAVILLVGKFFIWVWF